MTTATKLRIAAREPGKGRRGSLAGVGAFVVIAALAPVSAQGQGPAAPLGSLSSVAEQGRLGLAAPGPTRGIAQDPGRAAGSGTRPSLPDPRTLCYAFLGGPGFDSGADFAWRRPVRVVVSCAGHAGAATSAAPGSRLGPQFAVSSSRMALALADNSGRVRVFSLRPPYQELHWRGPTGNDVQMWGLQATCGTIAVWTAKGTIDGLTGAVIQVGPRAGFVACDRDRSVAVGISAAYPRPAQLTLGSEDVANTEPNFAVSPSGSWYAYVHDSGAPLHNPRWPICVVATSGPATSGGCTPECDLGWHAGGGARLGSVANDGSVIFAAGSYENPCPWCSSIYYWNPNTPKPVLPALLQKSGADPQWISPAAARALIARYKYLRAHRKHPARKGPQGSKKARLPTA